MGKILDVQEFISDQTQLHKVRRISQFIRFLDKTPAFPLYYHINKIKSTSELATHSIDAYIGDESPARYDKIRNLPLYGFPEITTESEFDELIGTNSEGYSGETIIIPGLLEPTEGDCFILEYFNNKVLFVVNNVSEVALKARPHFKVEFHIDSSDKIAMLERQVVSTSTAIFDNIGTENRVILEDVDFVDIKAYTAIYSDLHNHYMKKFMNQRTTTFETLIVDQKDIQLSRKRFVDKYLQMFMTENRILVMDNILQSIFMLDNNHLYSGNEYMVYESSIFHAVVTRSINMMVPTTYVHLYTLASPWSLFKLQTNDSLYVSQMYIEPGDENDQLLLYNNVEYSFNTLFNKIKMNDITEVSELDKFYNIIVKYMNDTDITLDDFKSVSNLKINDLDRYYMTPIILYILSLIIRILQKNVVEPYKTSI